MKNISQPITKIYQINSIFIREGRAVILQTDKFNIHPGRASSDTPNQDNVPSTNSGIKSDLLSQTLIERLQRNEISKKTSQTTITINIGKITVRAVNNSDSYRSIGNESRQSKKLSLNDYLRKRSEKEGQK